MIRLASCPHVYAGEEAFDVIGLAELLAKGLAPVPGGALDQAQVFLDAARLVWREQAYWESV